MPDSALSALLILSWVLPFFFVLILLVVRRPAKCLPFMFVATLPSIILSAVGVFQSSEYSLTVPWLLLGSEFVLDEFNAPILLSSALLWSAATLYTFFYIEMEKQPRFLVFFLLAMTGNFGLAVAGDALTFFMFFALMSFSAYGLVMFERSAMVEKAGRVYISFVVLSEVLLWAGLVCLVFDSPELGFESIVQTVIANGVSFPVYLVVVALGVKAGMFGLHVWLPLAHSVSPTPASAVLSGAMVKAGLIGCLRLLPIGDEATQSLGFATLNLGLIGMFWGAVLGCVQSKPKKLLAYSSVSQMGLGLILLGFALWLPDTVSLVPLLLLFIVHHCLNKGALFLSVGYIVNHRFTWPFFIVALMAGFSLVGLPLTSGMWVKGASKLLVGDLLLHGLSLKVWLLLSSVGTSVLMIRLAMLVLALRRAEACNKSVHEDHHSSILTGLTGVVVLAGFMLTAYLSRSSLDIKLLSGALINGGLLLGLTGIVYFLRFRLFTNTKYKLSTFEDYDLLSVYLPICGMFVRLSNVIALWSARVKCSFIYIVSRVQMAGNDLVNLALRLEGQAVGWSVAMALYLIGFVIVLTLLVKHLF